ncbi:MAG: DUF4136 domain-containing protein [Planctomycetes bacterium]|jgi:hypothetical protein|nr:DUF4136 domain-containing protein [Planctomycetota bacterium]
MRRGAVFAAVLLAACASVAVEVERDETARVPRLRTFAFSPGTPPALRDALERELAVRGLRPERKSPDLFVSGTIGEEERTEVSPFAVRPGSSRSPAPTSPRRTVRRTILALTAASAESGEIVWRGRAVLSDPETGASEAVRALVSEFPAAR